MKNKTNSVVFHENQAASLAEIQARIFMIRGVQVMLDRDLAILYHVETRALNQAVKRNIRRFPERFMFQLTKEEFESEGVSKVPFWHTLIFHVTMCFDF